MSDVVTFTADRNYVPGHDQVRGVRLSDRYVDHDGGEWEVVGLITEPQAVVRNVQTGEQEAHVIGCPNWTNKWARKEVSR